MTNVNIHIHDMAQDETEELITKKYNKEIQFKIKRKKQKKQQRDKQGEHF